MVRKIILIGLVLLMLSGGCGFEDSNGVDPAPLPPEVPTLPPPPTKRYCTLQWEWDGYNSDGTVCDDLDGFRVYYKLSQSVEWTEYTVVGATVYAISIGELEDGLWQFYVTAFDLEGNESVPSNQVEKEIPYV